MKLHTLKPVQKHRNKERPKRQVKPNGKKEIGVIIKKETAGCRWNRDARRGRKKGGVDGEEKKEMREEG